VTNMNRTLSVALAALALCALPHGGALAQDMRFRAVDHAVPFGATVAIDGNGLPGLIGVRDPVSTAAPAPDMRARGLAPLFTTADGIRDLRVVDVDGDGLADVVGNAKSDTAPMSAVLRLFRNLGGDTYREDGEFLALDLRGYGETLVIADFDNDGCADIYNPVYTFQDRCYDTGRPDGIDCRPGAPVTASGQARHAFLLLNTRTADRCTGRFREVAEVAGVGMIAGGATDPNGARPEGAQGVDFDRDGWIDLWVAGHLFMNKGRGPDGVPRFVDAAPSLKLIGPDGVLPPTCQNYRMSFPIEEGAQLLDWNGDGHLDLLIMHWACGPFLYEYVADAPGGPRFVERACVVGTEGDCKPIFSYGAPNYEPVVFTGNFGIKTQDLDGDGLVDIVASGRRASAAVPTPQGAVVFHNTGAGFTAAAAPPLSDLKDSRMGSVAFADFDRDGRVDVVYPVAGGTRVFLNRSARLSAGGTMYVEVVGARGERNQHGRMVTFTMPASGRKIVRSVDGGSGYLSQDEYTVIATTADAGAHSVKVVFRDAPEVPTRVVEFEMKPGETARVIEPSPANPKGTVELRRNSLWGRAG